MFKSITNQFAGYNAQKHFIPYIQMHEFEALLFGDAKILATKIGVKID